LNRRLWLGNLLFIFFLPSCGEYERHNQLLSEERVVRESRSSKVGCKPEAESHKTPNISKRSPTCGTKSRITGFRFNYCISMKPLASSGPA
jgi:hypothetical protein